MSRPFVALAACLSLFLLAACDDEKEQKAENTQPEASQTASAESGTTESTQTTGGETAGAEPGEAATSEPEAAGPTQGDAATPAAGPVQQDQFVTLVESARAELEGVDRADPAALKAASDAALAKRREAQCELFEGRPLAVEGWTGRVQGVHPLQDALTLQVAFAPNAFLMTSFGGGLDEQLGVKTAFREGDPLYATVQALKPGDEVVVSGTFFESAEGCIFQVSSMNPSEWIEYPTFLFAFERVEKK